MGLNAHGEGTKIMLGYKFSSQVPAGIQHEYGSAVRAPQKFSMGLKDLKKYIKETVTPMEVGTYKVQQATYALRS
jgi:hypothetical protein